MSYCPVRGDAVVTRTPDGIRWDQTDEEIHVSVELAMDPLVLERYTLVGWCPIESSYHFRLKSEAAS